MKQSIMPESLLYEVERFEGSHKHHIFGSNNRNKSEKYGLFVYLTPAMHNMSNEGVHFNKQFDRLLKRIAQQTAMKYYNWNMDEWMKIFGRNYL